MDKKTAVAWLQGSLRVRDNAVLRAAAAAGSGGLAVIVVWRHGDRVPTPSAGFMRRAVISLHGELTKRGSCLIVLRATEDTDEAAATAVAEFAALQSVSTVVVDASEEAGEAAATMVQTALAASSPAAKCAVIAVFDDTLLPHEVARAALVRSANGNANDGIVKWTGFLKDAGGIEAVEPRAAPASFPPPLIGATAPAAPADKSTPRGDSLPDDSTWWGLPTVRGSGLGLGGGLKGSSCCSQRSMVEVSSGFRSSLLGFGVWGLVFGV